MPRLVVRTPARVAAEAHGLLFLQQEMQKYVNFPDRITVVSPRGIHYECTAQQMIDYIELQRKVVLNSGEVPAQDIYRNSRNHESRVMNLAMCEEAIEWLCSQTKDGLIERWEAVIKAFTHSTQTRAMRRAEPVAAQWLQSIMDRSRTAPSEPKFNLDSNKEDDAGW